MNVLIRIGPGWEWEGSFSRTIRSYWLKEEKNPGWVNGVSRRCGGGRRDRKTAIQREIEEETGLLVEVLDLVEIFERIIPDPQGRILYHYVLLDYWCGMKDGKIESSK